MAIRLSRAGLMGALLLFLPFRGELAALEPATFGDSVWPILQARCVVCHRAGDIGPMALTSYSEVRPWASAIREAVQSRTMPPWHAVHQPSSHSFRNDRTLSAGEIATIVAWVDAGAPEGKTVPRYQAPAETKGWKLGKPDVVVRVPGMEVPKDGTLPYTFLIVPLHFDRDTWVRAAEFRIDQRAVVHHINAFIRPPGSSYLEGSPAGQVFVPSVAERGKRKPDERVFNRRELMLGYEPGYLPAQWMDDGGKLVKAGSDLVFEMHYNPNGKAAVDHSEFALFFAPAPPRNRIVAIDTLRDLDLAIPPQDGSYRSTAAMTLARPAKLLSIQPHMHVRGKSMDVSAIYPDGREEILVSVPRYDFHWQTTYAFSDPVALPPRTRLQSTATFDNSPNNGFNPDPAKTVHWGDQTTDEMHIAFLELVVEANANPDDLFLETPRMVGAPPAKSSR